MMRVSSGQRGRHDVRSARAALLHVLGDGVIMKGIAVVTGYSHCAFWGPCGV